MRAHVHTEHAWSNDLWDILFTCTTQPVVESDNVFVVIIVTSAPSNVRRRSAIRSTWGQRRHLSEPRIDKGTSMSVFPVFLVGDVEDVSNRRLVYKEATEFGDMLVGPYLDTYRNLTLKTVHGFMWVAERVRPTFVLKTDDDCFVNVDILLEVLTETLVFQSEQVKTASEQKVSTYKTSSGDTAGTRYLPSTPSYRSATRAFTRLPSPLYVGNVRWANKVVRNPTSRWFVSEQDYAKVQYPPYASGAGYVLDARALDVLTSNVRRIRPFPNEDAYVGTVLREAGVRPVQSYRFVSQPSGLWACNFLYIVVIHGVSEDQHASLVAKVKDARQQCRDVERDVGWD
ncbi:hypothetical protein V5799_022242 [Amblyomma americanum]|uniref:Hexosyltransferase n=1 Tax=Amblyomma americanum TaxID=6943 RepID=A0AAQ4FL01_AMBAM